MKSQLNFSLQKLFLLRLKSKAKKILIYLYLKKIENIFSKIIITFNLRLMLSE
jgi:hypothetical protein